MSSAYQKVLSGSGAGGKFPFDTMQEEKKNRDENPDGGGRHRRQKLKKLKESKNMIFIKKFNLQNCQGESQFIRILKKINGIDVNKFIDATDHTRRTRDNRVFVIVFRDSAEVAQIIQWADIINKARVVELGPEYEAFKYDKQHHQVQNQKALAASFKVVVKGLHNETSRTVGMELAQSQYHVQSVQQWGHPYGWFTVELATKEEAHQLAQKGNFKLGTQKAKVELLQPRKPRRLRKPIQCTNCQRHGHTAKFCTSATRCRYCGQNHKHDICPIKGQTRKYRCVCCKGRHAANSKRCQTHIRICERMGFREPKHENSRGANLRAPRQQRPNVQGGSQQNVASSSQSRAPQSWANAAAKGSQQNAFSAQSGNNFSQDVSIKTSKQNGNHNSNENSNENSNNWNSNDIQFDDMQEEYASNGTSSKRRKLNGGKGETTEAAIVQLKETVSKEKSKNQMLEQQVAQLKKQVRVMKQQIKQLTKQQNKGKSAKAAKGAQASTPSASKESSDNTDEDIEIDMENAQSGSNSKLKLKSKSKSKSKGTNGGAGTSSQTSRRGHRSKPITMEGSERKSKNSKHTKGGSTGSSKPVTSKGNNK